MLRDGLITIGHARPLLALTDEKRITDLAHETVSKGLSARDVEQRVRESSAPRADIKKRGRPQKTDGRPLEIRNLEEQLRRFLQTDVSIASAADHKGSIRIAFYSLEDLERVSDLIQSTRIPQ
jgi:ParB family chromosome partitioning protein